MIVTLESSVDHLVGLLHSKLSLFHCNGFVNDQRCQILLLVFTWRGTENLISLLPASFLGSTGQVIAPFEANFPLLKIITFVFYIKIALHIGQGCQKCFQYKRLSLIDLPKELHRKLQPCFLTNAELRVLSSDVRWHFYWMFSRFVHNSELLIGRETTKIQLAFLFV